MSKQAKRGMIATWLLYSHFMTDLFSSNANTASAGITADERRVLSVTDLNQQARMTIEKRFNQIWVSGELSSFARPSSGHWYFTLKDAKAQVRCAMFANANRRARLQPANGQQVLLRGRVSLYEGRGEFQIIVEHMEPAGEGALRAAFEALKRQLDAEGLFDSARKPPFLTFLRMSPLLHRLPARRLRMFCLFGKDVIQR